ncbi:MAG: hypothetical protein ACLR23_22610 [Clostridia bacterium]|uniref:Uncharacterized protein n=1 Tax=Bianquea renquensis TaxID=2763661 RepID=A0A926DT74_9FIRM|nr:hypothetical protein [Bianquea renquensis]MBC8543309.1 hypothetical protein [Bianquea renquensis]
MWQPAEKCTPGLAYFERLRRAMTIHISPGYGGGCDPVWQPVEKCTPGLAYFERLRRAIAIQFSSGYGRGATLCNNR